MKIKTAGLTFFQPGLKDLFLRKINKIEKILKIELTPVTSRQEKFFPSFS